MKDCTSRDYDALLENSKIEIKATTSITGKTTINPYKEFDMLYWLYIDGQKDYLEVTKIPYSNLQKSFSQIEETNDPNRKIRQSISLQNFTNECEKECFDLRTLEKIDILN